MPFITYLSGLLTAQMLSDDQLISGVEIRCEEKGRCPSTCHLCRRPGKEQLSPTPVLLEISRVAPLYSLIQDNGTKEAFKSALMSSYWCSGKGDVIDDWCRCDLSAFDASGLPNCSPLPQPVLRLSPTVEPSSTVVSLEWVDVQPAIGTKVSDYILQHKKVDEYTDTDLYTGEFLSFADDLLSGLGTSCVAAGRSHGEVPEVSIYSVIFKCLEPDGLYKFTLYAVDTRGRHSELSTVTLRTACPLVDDNKAEEIADKIYNLYNGYTSGKEQQTAYNTLMEVSASMLFRVQHHYNSHYEKFGDFVWRSEDELGPRKAHLILRRLERVSSHCSSLLRSAYIQSRVDTVPYLFCRSEEVRPAGMVWYSILKDTKITCEEKMVSMARNTPKAGAFRRRPSGLSSSSSSGRTQLPSCHGPQEETYGETVGPLQHQDGGPEDCCSEEAWVFRTFYFSDVFEFAGPLPLPAACGSAQSPCRTFHALKIPIVSLSAWVVFLTNGGASVYSVNK
ncbi:astrotactin-2 isoform X10 [Camelus ferus]|nr:astrotactin-2 isoform X10 [Camelus ferus]